MLNRWILMTTELLKRSEGAAQKRGGSSFLCTCSSASLLCHTYFHLLGLIPLFPSLSRSHTHTHTFSRAYAICMSFDFMLSSWIYTTSQIPVQQIEDLFTSSHEVFVFLLSHISFCKAHLTSCLLLFSYFCTLLPIWTKNLPWYMVFPFS